MVNISALNNMSQLDMNSTLANNSENLSQEMIKRANEQSDGWLGTFILFPIFLILLYEFSKPNGFFRLDFVRAGAAASGITTVIGFMLVIPGLITSYRQVVWYAVALAGFSAAALLRR